MVQEAAKVGQELIAIAGLRAMSAITASAVRLPPPDDKFPGSGLAWKPLSYLQSSALEAIAFGRHDVGVEGSRLVLRVFSLACEPDPGASDLAQYFETWRRLATALFGCKAPAAAGLVLRDWTEAIVRLGVHDDARRHTLLSTALDGLTGLVPAMVQNESATMLVPFAPYDSITGGVSLAGLVTQAADRALEGLTQNGAKGVLAGFARSCEPVRWHFRNLAELDLGPGLLPLFVLQTLRRISAAHLAVLEHDPGTDPRERKELVSSLLWHLSFGWVAYEKPTANFFHAPECADLLSWTGMRLLLLGVSDGVKDCASFICSIAESALKRGAKTAQVADILLKAGHIQAAADLLNHPDAAKEIGERIQKTVGDRQTLRTDLEGILHDSLNELRTAGDYAVHEPSELVLREIMIRLETDRRGP